MLWEWDGVAGLCDCPAPSHILWDWVWEWDGVAGLCGRPAPSHFYGIRCGNGMGLQGFAVALHLRIGMGTRKLQPLCKFALEAGGGVEVGAGKESTAFVAEFVFGNAGGTKIKDVGKGCGGYVFEGFGG